VPGARPKRQQIPARAVPHAAANQPHDLRAGCDPLDLLNRIVGLEERYRHFFNFFPEKAQTPDRDSPKPTKSASTGAARQKPHEHAKTTSASKGSSRCWWSSQPLQLLQRHPGRRAVSIFPAFHRADVNPKRFREIRLRPLAASAEHYYFGGGHLNETSEIEFSSNFALLFWHSSNLPRYVSRSRRAWSTFPYINHTADA